jgi:hypothetical protein
MGACANCPALEDDPFHLGPLFDNFPLTLSQGDRSEAIGPLFYSELSDTQHQWAVPPLGLSHTWDPGVEAEEFDLLYPLMTYDRFGKEYRWEFLQLLSFAGGQNQEKTDTRRFSLFPIYFQQRSSDPSSNYTAVGPFFGHLDHRLFRDEIDYVMFPFYSKTRKKDVITYNMPYPLFHLRYGDKLHGWQFWPFMGRETKEITTETNGFGETRIIGAHQNLFVAWPFYMDNKSDIGTGNPSWQQALVPFYSFYRSTTRNSTSYLWPIGFTHTIDVEGKYEEWDAPWPLIEFARGEGKTTSRVFPFFSQAKNKYLEDNWYMWPLYKVNRVNAPPLFRQRTRILFFLYSDNIERSTETGVSKRRVDFLPFFTYKRDFTGMEKLQVLTLLEPLFPNNKSIERDYSPLWALWRTEHNPKTDADSQSLLWNLYRRQTTPETKKISLLFGLFQYQSGPEGRRWRVIYVPFGKTPGPAAG